MTLNLANWFSLLNKVVFDKYQIPEFIYNSNPWWYCYYKTLKGSQLIAINLLMLKIAAFEVLLGPIKTSPVTCIVLSQTKSQLLNLQLCIARILKYLRKFFSPKKLSLLLLFMNVKAIQSEEIWLRLILYSPSRSELLII